MIASLRTVNIATPESEKLIAVHAVKKVDFSKNPQRVVFAREETANIKPGLYRASVYTKDNYMGSTEFYFRDSFMFF